MTRLQGFFGKHRRIALDSSIFIYFLEKNATYLEMAEEVFKWLEGAENSAVTSTLTMAEVLVYPYRLSNQKQVDQYFSLLSQFPNLEWAAPGLRIADVAARIRAIHRLRTPDALQVGTAIERGASAFLTNDLELSRVSEIEIVLLDHLR